MRFKSIFEAAISDYKVELVRREHDMHGEGGGTFPNSVWQVLKYLKGFGPAEERKIENEAGFYPSISGGVDYKKMVKYGIISKIGAEYQITAKGKKEMNKIGEKVI